MPTRIGQPSTKDIKTQLLRRQPLTSRCRLSFCAWSQRSSVYLLSSSVETLIKDAALLLIIKLCIIISLKFHNSWLKHKRLKTKVLLINQQKLRGSLKYSNACSLPWSTWLTSTKMSSTKHQVIPSEKTMDKHSSTYLKTNKMFTTDSKLES